MGDDPNFYDLLIKDCMFYCAKLKVAYCWQVRRWQALTSTKTPTVHKLHVALYLFPKFVMNVWLLSFLIYCIVTVLLTNNSRWPPSSKINRHAKDTFHNLGCNTSPSIYFQSFMNVWLIFFYLLHDSVLLRNSRWPPWRHMLDDESPQNILVTISLLPFIYFQSFMNVWLILFDLLHDSVLLHNSRWPPWRPCWTMNCGNKTYCLQSPCCPLFISKVSWMYDQYFTSYCSINISDGRKDWKMGKIRQFQGQIIQFRLTEFPQNRKWLVFCTDLSIPKVSWMYD